MKKKVFNLCLTSISTIAILCCIISSFIKNGVSDDGYGINFEFDENYLFFLYGSISLLIASIIDLVYYKRYNQSNVACKVFAPFLASAFLMSFYTKTFFKLLNKGEEFNELYFIVMISLICLTVYFGYNCVIYLHNYFKEHSKEN